MSHLLGKNHSQRVDTPISHSCQSDHQKEGAHGGTLSHKLDSLQPDMPIAQPACCLLRVVFGANDLLLRETWGRRDPDKNKQEGWYDGRNAVSNRGARKTQLGQKRPTGQDSQNPWEIRSEKSEGVGL